MTDFSMEFRTLLTETNWNAPSFSNTCYNGLSDIIAELAAREPPSNMDSLITAICVDDWLRDLSGFPPDYLDLKEVCLEKYITESLAAGIIWPSSSPTGARFFFKEKKDKALRPCINNPHP